MASLLPSFAIQIKASEHVLQCELKLTFSLCVVDEAEGLADCGVGSHQDGVVQDIDGLGPELQALLLDDREVLGDAEIDRLQTRPVKLPTWQLPKPLVGCETEDGLNHW